MKFSRAINIFLIYVILLDYMIPCAHAIDTLQIVKIREDIFPGNWSPTNTSNIVDASKSNPDQVDTKHDIGKKNSSVKQYILKSSASSPIQGAESTVGFSGNVGNGIVDEFTGDLNYSIPLMDVEGFPLILAYNPNIGMNDEASWVGLGWNLSLGSINREMRGVPDDFQGDPVVRTMKLTDHTKEGSSFGMNFFAGVGLYLLGSQTIDLSGGFRFANGSYFDNYSGEGKTFEFGLFTNASFIGIGNNASVGISTDTQNGVGYTRSFGFNGVPSAFGISFGGFQEQRSVTETSRSGIKTKSNTSGWTYGAKIFITGATFRNMAGSYRHFGTQTFVPRFANHMAGKKVMNVNSGLGIGGIGIFAGGMGMAKTKYSTVEKIDNYAGHIREYKAFGFNHMTKGQRTGQAIMDFNRGSSQEVNIETKTLGFSAPTYDIFHCSAPGFMSNYRSYRYDVYALRDAVVNQQTNITGEGKHNAGIVVLPTFGYQNEQTDWNGTERKYFGPTTHWQGNFKGMEETLSEDDKEYYYRTIGELTPVDNSLLTQFQGAQPSMVPFQIAIGSSNKKISFIPSTLLISSSGDLANVPTTNYNLNKPVNAVNYKELTIADLKTKSLKNYTPFECRLLNQGELIRVELPGVDLGLSTSAVKKDHHTGGVEVTNTNGFRYVFGLPSYSYEQSEISFSAALLINEQKYNETALVQYAPGDNSTANTRGRHAMYDRMLTPAYSSTFLLTEMYSDDYLDRTENGPSEDDHGNYYKVNYANIYGEDNPYNWRIPMCSDDDNQPFEYKSRLAYLNKNYHTDPWDDVANYFYGKKDLYYVASLESKNLIAYFCLEDRLDQFSMKGEDGGLDTDKPGKLLKKILLFAKNDIETSKGNPVPLQVIEFEYDYSLCQDYVGNINTYSGGTNSGKLTLKAVYTYTGNSTENKTAPIEFVYSDTNPDFKWNSSDRWGEYQPNNPSKPNHEFPFTDEQNASANIKAWKLTKVKQTSGGELSIQYERDSYHMVQNRRAMKMFNVLAMSTEESLGNMTEYDVQTIADLETHHASTTFRNPSEHKEYFNVIYFKLDEPINDSPQNARMKIIEDYLMDENGKIPDELFFDMYAKMADRDVDKYEHVQSSVKLHKLMGGNFFAGAVGNGSNSYKIGYVVIEPEQIAKLADDPPIKLVNFLIENSSKFPFMPFSIDPIFSYKVNPLAVANWQYARINTPCTVYGAIDYNATQATDFCDYNLSNDWNIIGVNLLKRFNKKNYGLHFDPNRSLMKLYDPDRIKSGGDSRISTITVSDGWDDLSGEAEASYIWQYEYGKNRVNTEGIASYEPAIGNIENPFYELDGYSYKRHLLPDEKTYQILPWGEMVYPGAIVGYAKVKADVLTIGSSVGSSITDFYTLRDKPTIADKTVMSKLEFSGKTAIKIDKVYNETFGFSQGFYVETSDYHGRPKKITLKDRTGNEIVTTAYNYYEKGDKIKYADRSGNISLADLPRDIDMYADSWVVEEHNKLQESSTTISAGISAVIPYFFMNDDEEITEYRKSASAFTFSKVIHHAAVIKSVETTYLGSHNKSEDLVYDARSGNVLLSYVKDEFNDDFYSLSYPAHWKYDNFRNISLNEGRIINQGDLTGIDNEINFSTLTVTPFSVGDVIEYSVAGISGKKGWIVEINDAAKKAYVIDEDGKATYGVDWSATIVTILKSGRKNRVDAQMMGITTKNSPLTNNQIVFPTTGVINVEAVRYKENNNLPCLRPEDWADKPSIIDMYEDRQYVAGAIINPFKKGVMGNYRLFTSYAFQNERTSGHLLGIRQDGTLTGYVPFYKLGSDNEWHAIDESGHTAYNNGDLGDWRQLDKITKFDEFGKPLESESPTKNRTTQLYGMNKDLKLFPKALIANAKTNEVAFDGLEDYYYRENNTIDYLGYGFSLYPGTNGKIDPDEKHTGDYSLRINGLYVNQIPVTYAPDPIETTHINGEKEYEVQECDCIRSFSPIVNNRYVFSVWIKENTRVLPYQETRFVIRFLDAAQTPLYSDLVFTPSGNVVDGWQKIEGEYMPPPQARWMRISIYTEDESVLYIDDFRSHPYNAAMSSVVYDQKKTFPLAEHDAYNYSIFYNYDENNSLVRTRVETVEGIQTVSEKERVLRRK